MSRRLNQFLQQNLDFVLPDGLKRVETTGGEDLQRANAAEVSPVIAVVGAGHESVVVGEKIQEIGCSSVQKRLFYKRPELHSLLVVFLHTEIPFSTGHPHYYVEGQLGKPRFQLNCPEPMSRRLNQFLQQNRDFVLPDGFEGVETAGGEDLQRANAAEVAPVIAVGGAG
nr:hypothetical protein CR513_19698 [Ipomoea batatas]